MSQANPTANPTLINGNSHTYTLFNVTGNTTINGLTIENDNNSAVVATNATLVLSNDNFTNNSGTMGEL